MNEQILRNVEELEERRALGIPLGMHSYEGHYRSQGAYGAHAKPSGRSKPEVSAGSRPQPDP